MNIVGMSVEWYKGGGNAPRFTVKVDEIPDHKALRYKRVPIGHRNAAMYLAESGGYVSYYYWLGEPDDGFDGQHFPIVLEDGTEVTLIGPYTSNPYVVNTTEGYPEVLDVSIYSDKKGIYAGSVTKAMIEEALPRFLPGVTLYREESILGGHAYSPSINGLSPMESKKLAPDTTPGRQPA